MKIKRIISIILTFAFLLSLCSCMGDAVQQVTDQAKNDTDSTEVTEKATDPSDQKADGDKDDAEDEFVNSDNLGELELSKYTVSYESVENGKIEGLLLQEIARGESAQTVTAVADEDYVFTKWSDGVKSAERTDENVTGNIKVSPIFVHKNTVFTATYTVVRAGAVVDAVTVEAKVGESVSYSAPKPMLAYEFGGWDDGVDSAERTDVLTQDVEFVGEYTPEYLGVAAICINTEDGRGIESKTEYKRCEVSLVNAEEDQCFEGLGAKIRGRGNSSWDYPKKGFRLKFDHKVSMLGSEHKAKGWVFISNYGDKSLLRNMLGYDMSDRMDGLKYTVMHEFIDVYLNGEYYGLFMMCDGIEAGEGRVEIDETFYSDPSQMSYMLEIGMTDSVSNGRFRASRDYNRTYGVELPDIDDPRYDPEIHLEYIKDYVDQCLKALSDQDWELICELMDIDSFIDYYIIQELYMNKDCFWRSVHFYKEGGGKLYIGPVWDLDQGFGAMTDFVGQGLYEVTPRSDLDTVVTHSDYDVDKQLGKLWIASAHTWYRRLLRMNEFKELLRERLVEFGPILREVMAQATTDGSNPDSYYSKYGEAMERNFKRWDIMYTSVWPNTPAILNIRTLKGQIDYIHDWALERYDVLCEYYGVST